MKAREIKKQEFAFPGESRADQALTVPLEKTIINKQMINLFSSSFFLLSGCNFYNIIRNKREQRKEAKRARSSRDTTRLTPRNELIVFFSFFPFFFIHYILYSSLHAPPREGRGCDKGPNNNQTRRGNIGVENCCFLYCTYFTLLI